MKLNMVNRFSSSSSLLCFHCCCYCWWCCCCLYWLAVSCISCENFLFNCVLNAPCNFMRVLAVFCSIKHLYVILRLIHFVYIWNQDFRQPIELTPNFIQIGVIFIDLHILNLRRERKAPNQAIPIDLHQKMKRFENETCTTEKFPFVN